MKFGLCAKLDMLPEAAALGFDYLEPPVNAVAAMTGEEFAAALQAVKAAGIPCPAFNLLFPKTLALLSPATTDAQVREYLEGALMRVAALGGETAVFGSGKSRSRPQDMPYGEAFRRLAHLTRLTGEVAARHGITIVIEPLNRTETNMICSMAEGAALVAAADHPNVKLLSDFYHVVTDGEPVEDVVRLGGVSHAHVATRQGRRFPLNGDEALARFMSALKATGYHGMLSIEGKTDDITNDAPAALAVLKKCWEEA